MRRGKANEHSKRRWPSGLIVGESGAGRGRNAATRGGTIQAGDGGLPAIGHEGIAVLSRMTEGAKLCEGHGAASEAGSERGLERGGRWHLHADVAVTFGTKGDESAKTAS